MLRRVDGGMMNTLHLTVKRPWFDMIAAFVKTEEYRDIKPYWAVRLLQQRPYTQEMEPGVLDEMICDMRDPFRRHNGPDELLEYFGVKFKEFDVVRFRNGYAKSAPTCIQPCNRIRIGQGKAEWGAEPGKYYFIIDIYCPF